MCDYITDETLDPNVLYFEKYTCVKVCVLWLMNHLENLIGQILQSGAKFDFIFNFNKFLHLYFHLF